MEGAIKMEKCWRFNWIVFLFLIQSLRLVAQTRAGVSAPALGSQVVTTLTSTNPSGPCTNVSTEQFNYLTGDTWGCVSGIYTDLVVGAVKSVNSQTGTVVLPTASQFNIKDYGAVGDGLSHPGCAYLGISNLSGLQAYKNGVYKFATSCTNQIDWLALSSAIRAAAASSGGGTIFAPSGVYMLDQPVTFPVGVNDSYYQTGGSVSLNGEDVSNTFFEPVTDFGSGSALFSCGVTSANASNGLGRYGFQGMCYSHLANFTLRNSLITSLNPGAPPMIGNNPVQMDGLVWGARMALYRVRVEGFRAGINAVGDHTTWEQVSAQANQWGVYMAPTSQFLYGDLRWSECSFNGNTIAGIYIDKDSTLNVLATKLYVGYQPYAFLGMPGTPDSYAAGLASNMITDSTFFDLQGENLGNGLIVDDNATSSDGADKGAKLRALENVHIDNLYCSWDVSKRMSGNGRGNFAWIDVQYANGLFLTALHSAAMPAATGMLSAIRLGSLGFVSGGVEISGEVSNWINQYASLGLELVSGMSIWDSHPLFVRFTQPGVWEGGLYAFTSSTTNPISSGALLESVGGAQVQLAGGSKPVMGINVQNWITSPAGKFTVYADRGKYISVNTAGPVNSGQLLKAAPGGKAVPAANVADGFTVGQALNSGTTQTYAMLMLGH